MNTQIFFIMLVLLSFTLAYPQSAGNTLFRRGDCASGGVCLTKRAEHPYVAAYKRLKIREAINACTKSKMEGEQLCEGEGPTTYANAQQILDRFES
jgi:hypothetical protein